MLQIMTNAVFRAATAGKLTIAAFRIYQPAREPNTKRSKPAKTKIRILSRTGNLIKTARLAEPAKMVRRHVLVLFGTL